MTWKQLAIWWFPVWISKIYNIEIGIDKACIRPDPSAHLPRLSTGEVRIIVVRQIHPRIPVGPPLYMEGVDDAMDERLYMGKHPNNLTDPGGRLENCGRDWS